MTINELLLFTFFVVNLIIFLIKTYNLISNGDFIPYKFSLILLILSLFSNSIVISATLSLSSAKIVPPSRPWQDAQYVIEIPPNQAMLSAYMTKFSGFLTTIIMLYTIVETIMLLKKLTGRYRRRSKYYNY